MELKQAIRTRVSTAAITDEAPSDESLRELLSLAAHSPDHASLRAWRLVSLRGADRSRLGAAMAVGFGDLAGTPEAQKTAAKALRAPLLLGIIAAPREHPKVPAWEQVAATAGMITTLQLLLFEAGYTAMWRSGPAIDLPEVRAVMGLADGELLLGWLYIGGTAPGQPLRGSDPDVADRIRPLPATAED
jgi:nitroreductase